MVVEVGGDWGCTVKSPGVQGCKKDAPAGGKV